MNFDWNEQLWRYFDGDDELTANELQSLQQWLASDEMNLRRFQEFALLHDQLRGHLLAQVADVDHKAPVLAEAVTIPTQTHRPVGLRLLSIAALAVTILLLWFAWRGGDSALAGQSELRRLISANAEWMERCYRIDVESNVVDGAKPRERQSLDKRPPKPPLDGAVLTVRNKNEFVLERILLDGRHFVTGSDGKTSWMVPPEGAVRVSTDLQRFNRDVPGHEYSMSLCSLDEALMQLQSAYDVIALPDDDSDSKSVQADRTRLLVATKKRGFPGPRRVEITYLQASGSIRRIRFVEMPYGPDRLTLQMTLIEGHPHEDLFFQHSSHHATNSEVIED